MKCALALLDERRVRERVRLGELTRVDRDHAGDVARLADGVAEQCEALAQDLRLEPAALARDLMNRRRRHRDEIRVACDRVVHQEPRGRQLAAQLGHVGEQCEQRLDRRHRDATVAVLHRAARDVLEFFYGLDHRTLGGAHVFGLRTANLREGIGANPADHFVGRDEVEDVPEVGEQHQQARGHHGHREQEAAARQHRSRDRFAREHDAEPNAQHRRQHEEQHHGDVHAVAHEQLGDAVRVTGGGHLDHEHHHGN